MKGNFNNSIKSKEPPCPAPLTVPGYTPGFKNTNPNIFYQYINTYIYLWLENNESFWYYPTGIEAGVITGYAWDIFGWYEKAVDINEIISFY